MFFGALLTLFIILPILELALLLKVGALIGPWPTLAVVVGTGVLGATLARWQGLQLLFQIQRDMAEGRMPAPRLLDGLMILIAAVLLVTPGFITDAAGFLLLVPAFRDLVKIQARKYIQRRMQTGVIDVTYWE
ncbi:MAG: FxsA family protein [Kiritimatiellae bacterium]|nr:FxsA family protein [Kiritimatiellia bacterium]